MEYRTERDSMGEVQVPAHAYYGASTQRAVENFPISTLRFGRRFIWALGLIKSEAARVNQQLGIVADDVAQAVAAAADEVAEGRLDDQFVVDIFQTGSGTSTNMNANEVIANRAAELLGSRRGDGRVHPNDHVNPGQSSNDVIPSALHLAAVGLLREELIPSVERLATSLQHKAEEFDGVVKSGRTHLMDATPIRLGQEFGGYAAQVGKGAERLRRVLPELEELALGGTAVGTGLNAPEGFGGRVIERLARRTGYPLREAENHFEAQGAKDGVVSASGALRTVAVSLFKIANDLRWMASGPGAGIAEIRLPSLQPGSSIMPGKENPVICEAVMQLTAQVVGNDTAVVWGGANGNFELNVMMPVMAHNLLQSAELLASGAEVLRAKAVEGIEADQDRCRELVERNVSIVTSLAPSIGYDQAAEIAKAAVASGRSVRRVALEKGVLSAEELDEALDLRRMTEGGIL